MAKEALELVLKDAGLAKDAIQAAYVSNTFWGMFSNQHSIRGEVMLWDIGMNGIPIVNCENACAGASTALHLGIPPSEQDVRCCACPRLRKDHTYQ